MTVTTQLLFDAFQFDPDNACLWRGAQALSLTPKAFAVLQSLVEHSGHLVTKAALPAAVWPETAVGEAVLKVCVRELRQALGDSAQAPRFIAPLTAADGRATTGEGGPQQEPSVVVAR